MLLNCGVGEDFLESLGLQGDPICPSQRKSVLNIHWKDWCWSWNSNTLATWCEKLTHWKRLWCWERLKVGGEADREWDGCMASPTQWTWVWVSSGSWWWTGKPGMLQSMGSQRVRQDWATELISINTISYICIITPYSFSTHSRISFSEITRALGYIVNIYVFSYISSQLQHVDSSPLSGDLTWVPCIGSSESWTQVQSPIQEDSTHHMWPMCHNSWAHVLKPVCLEPVLLNKRCHHSENSTRCNKE